MTNVIYCPICQKHLTPVNESEVAAGFEDSHIYVHDDVVHEASDIQALEFGIQ